MASVEYRLTRGDLLRVFGRLLFLQATVHRRGMQNLGLLHALSPAVGRIRDGDLLARHGEYFNTNPHVAPLVVGGVLRLEECGDGAAPASISRFKQTAGSVLAAMGDMLFAGTLKPLALTLACVSAIYGFFPGLVAVLLLYNAVVISCRYWGISFGYAKGWDLVEAFSGPRFQRVLAVVQGAAACAGGLLVGVVVERLSARGWVATLIAAAVAVLAVALSRRGVPASRLAIALFPLYVIVARVVR